MRSSTIVSVLFAARALATPVLDKRAYVTHEVVVTVTDYVTVGADAPATTSTTAIKPVKESPKVIAAYKPHTRHHYHHQSSAKAVVPVPETPTSKAVAPTPTSTTEQVYVPPSTSSSKAAPATTAAPKKSSAAPVNNDLPKTKVSGLTSEDEVYKGLSLQHHNVHRSNHSVAALEWNQTLADFAKTTAQTCVWGHSLAPGGGGYGQNIAAGTEAGNIASVLSNGFYNGEEPSYPSDYGNNNPDMSQFEVWGHYSQMVWAKTESVGCYTYTCSPPGASPLDCKPDGTPYLKNTSCKKPGVIPMAAIFTVCNYYPAGNYAGEYSNVKKPNGAPTVAMTDNGVIGL